MERKSIIKTNHLVGFSLLSLFTGKVIFLIQTAIKGDTHLFSPSNLHFYGIIVSILCVIELIINQKQKLNKYSGFSFLLFAIYIFSLAIVKSTSTNTFLWPYFPEFGLQIILPIITYLFIQQQLSRELLRQFLLVAVALTFFGHGAFAVGWFFPVPGNFIEMTSGFFQCSHETSLVLLRLWGMIDFALVILIFIPKLRKYALFYAFIWGIATALARIFGYWNDGIINALVNNSGGTIYRLLHGLVPLYLISADKSTKS